MYEAQRTDARQRGLDELLNDIPRRVRLPAHVMPADAVSAVLCTLSQHVCGAETRHLLDAVPEPSRPALQRCAAHRDLPSSRFDRQQMLERVGQHLVVSKGDAEDITAAVMTAIGLRVRLDQVQGLPERLPLELRELWVVRRLARPVDAHPIFSEIEEHVRLPYGLTGMGAFTAVMSTLSRRFSRSEAQLVTQLLPLDLRPLVAEGRSNRCEEAELFGRAELFARVSVQLDVPDAAPVVRAVFRAVQQYLRTESVELVAKQLPPDLQDVWTLC